LTEPLTLDERESDEFFEDGVLDILRDCWREVFPGEHLHPEVEGAAFELMLRAGGVGIPGFVVMPRLDPREALASVLRELDPARAKRLLDHGARMPEVYHFRSRALTPEQAMRAMTRLIRQARRGDCLRPQRAARAPRPVRRVARTCSARGDPDDDDPDLDPPGGPA